jgi:hypothetical protein
MGLADWQEDQEGHQEGQAVNDLNPGVQPLPFVVAYELLKLAAFSEWRLHLQMVRSP